MACSASRVPDCDRDDEDLPEMWMSVALLCLLSTKVKSAAKCTYQKERMVFPETEPGCWISTPGRGGEGHSSCTNLVGISTHPRSILGDAEEVETVSLTIVTK